MELPLLFLVKQLKKMFMHYVIKEESKGEPLSDNERAIGKRIEDSLQGLKFMENEVTVNGAVITKTNTHFIWSKGEREVTVEIGTGFPSVRKTCNTVRKAESRVKFLLQTEKCLSKDKPIRKKKVA